MAAGGQAPAVLPELDPQLGRSALRILRRRGLDARLETTIEEITGRWVRLSDGTTVPTRTVVWCVGVTPGPLTQVLGLETVNGRIVVDEFLAVPGHPRVFAVGDAAAAPDLASPGRLTPMTAQHAQRQGGAVARNVAASLGHGTSRAYKHRDLGFVVDLGGWQAVANPLRVPLSGAAAKVVTRGYTSTPCPPTGCGWPPTGSTTSSSTASSPGSAWSSPTAPGWRSPSKPTSITGPTGGRLTTASRLTAGAVPPAPDQPRTSSTTASRWRSSVLTENVVRTVCRQRGSSSAILAHGPISATSSTMRVGTAATAAFLSPAR
jgi:hypothetical protein